MIQTIDFAPLDGITKIVFRQVWSQFFGGVDRYFIPFFSPTPHHLMTPRDLREVDYIHNANLPSVPQVMTKNADDFLWACDVLKDMGYTEVNLNLGCPSGTVTAKGKGSGFLAHPNELAAFFDEVFSKNPLPVSVKTRLGYETPEEFAALLDLYNRYPIACLTVHPRVRKEKYRGPVHLDAFADALANSRNPVCYNGDLRTVGEVRALEGRFPDGHACDDRPGTGSRPSAGPEAPGRQGHRPRGTDRFSGRAVSGLYGLLSGAGPHCRPADAGGVVLPDSPV